MFTQIMYVNIKVKKDLLNMKPACSACLCVNERRLLKETLQRLVCTH